MRVQHRDHRATQRGKPQPKVKRGERVLKDLRTHFLYETSCAFGAPLSMKIRGLRKNLVLNTKDLGLFSQQGILKDLSLAGAEKPLWRCTSFLRERPLTPEGRWR